MWTQARRAFYAGSALAGLAFVASMMGWATYDTNTGMVDPHPFNVWTVGAVIATVAGNAMAFVATALGWGRK